MNKLFFSKFSYAETHYKFKLPWSPLFKSLPEIFIDGPSACVPGIKPQFYIVFKDADYFPVKLLSIDFYLTDHSVSKKQTLQFQTEISNNLIFIPLDLDFSGLSGTVSINGKIEIENKKGKKVTFLNSNYPGLSPSPLLLKILTQSLPYPTHWLGGELHCHSDYSNDPVEFGAPLKVLQEAGKSLGLGFVVCTDHSYDFYYQKTRYMTPTDPEQNFQNYRSEALELNRLAGVNDPTLIPGEEVSCGNQKGENIHLLVAGFEKFIPGLGDGGRRWLNNNPDLSIPEVLDLIGDTPCFAAHPKVQIGFLERLIFRRGMWDPLDLNPSPKGRMVNGLQFWNGSRKSDFHLGRKLWIDQLLEGKRLSPIGANDAHGDLNQNIGVKTPLVSLYKNRNHVFGHVRTVVKAKDKTVVEIQKALKSDQLFCTDGPFLQLTVEGNNVFIVAKSNPDFGDFDKATIFFGMKGEATEGILKAWNWQENGPFEVSERVLLPNHLLYVRSEISTRQKSFALTSALFLET